jgi:hypothetical protein
VKRLLLRRRISPGKVSSESSSAARTAKKESSDTIKIPVEDKPQPAPPQREEPKQQQAAPSVFVDGLSPCGVTLEIGIPCIISSKM